MSDIRFMQKALELAAKGRGGTSPNPMVGAVITKGNKILGEGYHKKAGTPHAEILALKRAGTRAKGATLYVSLEPCCHTNKRTPPCVRAIIKAGIKKVVVAMTDPNPSVSGRGTEELRAAGIEVVSGIMKTDAGRLNEQFIKYITRQEPFVILKIAQSLDGKIATAKGESRWITGADARKYVHKIRNEVDALMVGIGTVVKDDPSLDCRIRGGTNPYRVIVDSSLRIPLGSRVLKHNDGRTVIATTGRAPKRKIRTLENRGVKVLMVKEKGGKADLKNLMRELGKLEIMSVMIEGGSSIAAAALASNIVDKVMFFVAPKIIGGTDSIPSVGGPSPKLLKNSIQLKDMKITSYGDDVLLEGYINRTDQQ